MSLPELCIRRPVMTSLLMLSFIVFGLFGYRQLPVSALPRVDFPTISVYGGPARREPRHHGLLGRRAAGARVRHHPRHHHDDFVAPRSARPNRHAVRPRPQHRRRRARRAVEHFGDPAQTAAAASRAAELPEAQPGRQPDPVHRADFQDAAADDGRRLRRAGLRRADLAAHRRRAGAGVRRSRNSRCASPSTPTPPRRAA